MLPLIKNEVTQKKKWITSEDFIDGAAVAQSVPGAIVINIATFIGNKISGKRGAIAAVLGAALPSLITIMVVARFFLQFRELTIVQHFFKGAAPAIVSLIASAIIGIGKESLRDYRPIIITIGLLFLIVYLHIHPILAIVIAGISRLFFKGKQ